MISQKNGLLLKNPSSSKLAYQQKPEQVFALLNTQSSGLSQSEAKDRLIASGPNCLPAASPPSILFVFVRQFLNPLIYVLLVVGLISIFLGHMTDSLFIFGVLLFNAIIGTFQEYHAEKSALALKQMTPTKALVRREGEDFEVNSENLVLGDIVLLESGFKVPADIRLNASNLLEIDESLLTGESVPVVKDFTKLFTNNCPVSDQQNMAFAGSLVTRGKGVGVVIATALETELGSIAQEVLSGVSTKTPLLIRMETFSKKIAYFSVIAVFIIGAALLAQGQPFSEVLLFAVALGVAAIPEGLPVALTVALSVASRRMAKKNVIVRKLAAVEALGSCTFIGTDKTGTLTVNELTAKQLVFPNSQPWNITGTGIVPEGELVIPSAVTQSEGQKLIKDLCQAVVLCNDSFLGKKNNNWVTHGDSVDIALLVMAHKINITKAGLSDQFSKVTEIPFGSEHQFSATVHESINNQKSLVSVKGAYERLLPMCNKMATEMGDKSIDVKSIIAQADNLANNGYRVLSVASRNEASVSNLELKVENLKDLTFLGLIGMIDPLRPEAKLAIEKCHNAGIGVAMITGDHPITALSISRDLGLTRDFNEVVNGSLLEAANSEIEFDKLVAHSKVFARVSPQQKLKIVESLQRQNHFVAVTGDGANDAPALKAAHVGVSMGKMGTDVARETSDLIISDDKFSSIVAGIEQGRVAYDNIRRVIYLVVSTGAAEIVLFILSLLFKLPMPLTAVQLLWLNLVTNGIQDMALAFEPAEGDELLRPPRPKKEPVFNRIMLERIALSALVMGGVTFFVFRGMIETGSSISNAQNVTLLLMVLFENVMIGNARSEYKSGLSTSPLRNPLLLFGTIAAQLAHVWAMHSASFSKVLGVHPISLSEWSRLLLIALTIFLAVETHKLIRRLFVKL